jgi:hypothetical protein
VREQTKLEQLISHKVLIFDKSLLKSIKEQVVKQFLDTFKSSSVFLMTSSSKENEIFTRKEISK